MSHEGQNHVENDPVALELAWAGWATFTAAVKWAVIIMAVILGLMGLFLL